MDSFFIGTGRPKLSFITACAVLVLVAAVESVVAQTLVSRYSKLHFTNYGVRFPSKEFTDALELAAVDISHLSCRKSLVMLGMANEEALTHTVPHFLESLRRVKLTTGTQAGQTLDSRVVLVAWSPNALDACRNLQRKYGHKCVHDAEHRAGHASFGFHEAGFNSLGFAKVKYILNGLSAGHDVVFLDTDIVILQDPLPHFLATRADVLGAMEKCMIYNTAQSLHSPEFVALNRSMPAINIGVLYFRSTAAVTRCVFNWIWEMHTEARSRPRVWDQDVFGKVVLKCTDNHKLNVQVLDPRLFQSGCYPGCGCSYGDAEVNADRIGKFSRGFKKNGRGLCGPKCWKSWLLRHFPCSGVTIQKAELMKGLLHGYHTDVQAMITLHRDD